MNKFYFYGLRFFSFFLLLVSLCLHVFKSLFSREEEEEEEKKENG